MLRHRIASYLGRFGTLDTLRELGLDASETKSAVYCFSSCGGNRHGKSDTCHPVRISNGLFIGDLLMREHPRLEVFGSGQGIRKCRRQGVGEHQLVTGNPNRRIDMAEHVFHDNAVVLTAQDQPDARVVAEFGVPVIQRGELRAASAYHRRASDFLTPSSSMFWPQGNLPTTRWRIAGSGQASAKARI